ETDWHAERVHNCVVERKGTAEERVVLAGQPQHDELTRPDGRGDVRAVEANAKGPLGDTDVLDGAGDSLDDHTKVISLQTVSVALQGGGGVWNETKSPSRSSFFRPGRQRGRVSFARNLSQSLNLRQRQLAGLSFRQPVQAHGADRDAPEPHHLVV